MLVHGRYPPSITKSKTGVEQTKENPNLHSYRSIFTRGSLCSRWTLQIQKTIEGYRVEHPFYFLFSHPKISNEILTHYLYPPELWKECIRKAVLGRGSGGLIPTPPPPLLLPFPHLYHGLFFQFITNRVFEKTFLCCWYEVRLRCNIDIFAQPPALLATTLDLPQTRAVSNLMKASNV